MTGDIDVTGGLHDILHSHPQKARPQITRRQPRQPSESESRMSSDDHSEEDTEDDNEDNDLVFRSGDLDDILLTSPVLFS